YRLFDGEVFWTDTVRPEKSSAASAARGGSRGGGVSGPALNRQNPGANRRVFWRSGPYHGFTWLPAHRQTVRTRSRNSARYFGFEKVANALMKQVWKTRRTSLFAKPSRSDQ